MQGDPFELDKRPEFTDRVDGIAAYIGFGLGAAGITTYYLTSPNPRAEFELKISQVQTELDGLKTAQANLGKIDTPAEIGLQKLLKREIGTKQTQITTLSSHEPPKSFSQQFFPVELFGGAIGGAFVLAGLAYGVKYSLHRRKMRALTSASVNRGLQDFEDMLKSRD